MKKCSDFMTRNPVCCLPSDTVEMVARLMKNSDIGPIPVIESDQTKKLLGIVTDRDLALKVVAEGRDVKSTKASDVMTRMVITCNANDDLQKALDAMADHQLRRVVIVDEDARVLGIISQADVATRVGQPEKTAEVVKEISMSNSR
jgi:CBS domain-containing protein